MVMVSDVCTWGKRERERAKKEGNRRRVKASSLQLGYTRLESLMLLLVGEGGCKWRYLSGLSLPCFTASQARQALRLFFFLQYKKKIEEKKRTERN
jgi:hypothetical protein